MLRFLFSFDEHPAEQVYNETTAYYRLDDTLRLAHGPEVVWEEIALLLVEHTPICITLPGGQRLLC